MLGVKFEQSWWGILMLRQRLLFISIFIFLFFNLKPNLGQKSSIEKKTESKITIEKIRKEVNALPKSLLGSSRVNLESSPNLYQLIEKLTKKMDIKMPFVFVAKGFFGKKVEDVNKFLEFVVSLIMPLICDTLSSKVIDQLAKKTEIKKTILNNKTHTLFTKIVISSVIDTLVQLPIFHAILKTNAFSAVSFSGPTINLGVNLINNLNIDELEAIIAHELSHQKYKHVLKRNLLEIIEEYLSIHQSTYKIVKPTDSITINILVKQLFNNYIFRTYEKEADLGAEKYTKKPLDLINGLNKVHSLQPKLIQLYMKTLEKFYWPILSHPTLKKRKEYLIEASNKLVVV